VHADSAYRKEVAPVCVRRALEAAVARMTKGKGR
jgi:CO/xanthine dehydrogenase FAD-binding subunit